MSEIETQEPPGPPLPNGGGPPPTRLDVQIIGPLRIGRGAAVLDASALGGPKPRQILEILLLSLGSPVSKDRIVDMLWAGHPPAEALPTVESYVSVIRRHLQPGQGRTGPLRTVTGGYVIDAGMVDLDLRRFERLLRQASRSEPRQALEILQRALSWASAPLLGDELLAVWADEARSHHAARVNQTRTLAAEIARSLNEPEKAIFWARETLADDPLNEKAWSCLVLGLEESGQPLEALRAFERYRRVLDREMGCAPAGPLRSAHARLLQTTAAAGQPGTEPTAGGPGRARRTDADRTLALEMPDPAPASEPCPQRLRIVIVDDHRTFTELLSGALDREPDLQCIGSAVSVATGVQLCRELSPDVVVMDYHLPDGDGLTAAARILETDPKIRIVMLTGDPSQDALRRAAGLGICGFLPKDGSLATMLDALRHARTGNMVVHPSLLAQPGVPRADPPGAALSSRELDVLRLLAEGRELRAIAQSLGISLHTCRSDATTAFSKLGSPSQREARAEAAWRGTLGVTASAPAS